MLLVSCAKGPYTWQELVAQFEQGQVRARRGQARTMFKKRSNWSKVKQLISPQNSDNGSEGSGFTDESVFAHWSKNPLASGAHRKLPWIDLKEVEEAVVQDSRSLIVLGLGVPWSLPSFLSMSHLHELEGEVQGTKTFLVNQESARDYCEKNHIFVGGSAMLMWCRGGRPVYFISEQQSDAQPSALLTGPFGKPQLKRIIKRVLTALKQSEGANDDKAIAVII